MHENEVISLKTMMKKKNIQPQKQGKKIIGEIFAINNNKLTLAGIKDTREFSTSLEGLLDSEWIAEVCLNGQIKPSYIPCREIRDIRELTITHVKLTQAITAFKNRVHKILVLVSFPEIISSFLTSFIFSTVFMKFTSQTS